jgi:hypothetical protein
VNEGLLRKTVFAVLGIQALLSYRAIADTPVYVGFLEGPQTTAHDASPPISARTHVRIAFRKDGVVWKPMASNFDTPSALSLASRAYPSSVQWTVVFDGRTLGNLASQNPGKLHWYADIGTHILTTKAAPVVRTGAADFVYGSGDEAKTRPLLLISGVGTSAPSQWDPQGWKPSSLSPEERRLAVAAFRGKIAKSERCDTPEQEPIHRVSYSDNAVAIIKSYRDNIGEVLFGARLKDPKANCDFFDDQTFFDYWFAIDRQQRLRYLDSQMTPIDAADLDHSGRSAWLFFTSRNEDNDGYELFYDDLKKKAQFQWSYH